jgi:hypothetical protein
MSILVYLFNWLDFNYKMSDDTIKVSISKALTRNRRLQENNLSQSNVAIDKFDLHKECSDQCRSSIILEYVERYPQLLAMADKQADLPLHNLLRNKSSTIDDALMMIKKYPAALNHRNMHDRLPLHIECMTQCRSAIISRCIELYPRALAKSDSRGHLPLNRLLQNESSTIDNVLMIIEKYPEALQQQMSSGDFALHIEYRYQRRSSIIAKCIELYPQALNDEIIIGISRKDINWKSKVPSTEAWDSRTHASVLSIIFTARPMSLYPSYHRDDIRDDPYHRRRILNLLPRHVFTQTHESDYRDLNWQPRAAMIMLLSHMEKMKRQARIILIETHTTAVAINADICKRDP